MEKYEEKRPWGGFEQFTFNEISTVKILEISPGQKFSLQYHNKRKEFWRFLDNSAKVTIGGEVREMAGGDEVIIPPKTNHRIE
ncbi:cupin domain-containing protein, partial [archaeon]|nr:cupin domain-containing protein [archaeon]